MARCNGKAIGIAAYGAMEQIADGEVEEGAVLSAGEAQGWEVIVFGHGIKLWDNG